VDTYSCVALIWMRFCNLDGMLGLFEVRARDHKLLATSIESPLNNVFEVVFMSLRAVVLALENWIGKIDTDLDNVSAV
jgi:hypothetical protein